MRGVHGAGKKPGKRPLAMAEPPRKDGAFGSDDIVVAERLGGLLRHYRWEDAA
jgi:hypothetical protein